ncbi:MAG TPA: DUF4139 domain-containing protein [Candidatus Acidoferrales bacterium]|nr:DUF4139 domain-containing protein [Candidatus Acidoferrales bacterium]
MSDFQFHVRKNLGVSSITIRAAAAAVILCGLAFAVPLVHAVHKSSALNSGAGASDTIQSGQESTGADQTDLALTVYNSNIALVRDTREISLQSGESALRFMDIAASINPATVHLRSLTEPDKLGIVEQNYEYDLLEPSKLLQKYVGREVTLLHRIWKDGTPVWVEEKATLLADNGGPVWKIGDQIVTGMDTGTYRFPELPENLYSRPTLVWTLDNSGARKQKVEASYLAQNISWSADYVLNVARNDTSADLDGWVTLVNNSGTGFRNAQLQLVAGDLNRVVNGGGIAGNLVLPETRAMKDAQMAQESFSEYHLYTLGHRTSVNNQETKQVSMLHGTSFPVQKVYVVNGNNYYYRQNFAPGQAIKDPVLVYYKFRNEEKTGLGVPLPAGTVRVYQADSHGGTLFVGEDRISHTPKDEDVNVHIGSAFDVVSERKQTDYKKIADRVVELEYEITLRNHKDAPVTVEVNEPIGGDWEMLSSTYKFAKTAAFAAQFQVPVAKDGTSVLRYRVRARW